MEDAAKRYLVTYVTDSGAVYTLVLKGTSFADVEKQISVFPTIRDILQITIYN